MVQGAIRRLVHLSAGTDLPSTHLISAANGVGYGYIGTADGDVFFDYSAVNNRAFDQLTQGTVVDYVLDQALYLRSSDVTIATDRATAPTGAKPLTK